MSARNAMAAMLDELMGTKRNLDIGTDLTVTYDDPNICKFYIAGFCPHEMFVNTKADLGQCHKIHDDKLRIEYPSSSAFEKMGFEQDFLRFLIRLEDDNQRRIKRNKEKLNQTDALTQKREEERIAGIRAELAQVEEDIKRVMKATEEAGARNDVSTTLELVKQSEILEQSRLSLITKMEMPDLTNIPPALAPMLVEQEGRQKDVCEVCGSMLIRNDAQVRVEEHLMGKMHMGFAKIQVTIKELKEKFRKQEEEKDKEREERKKKRDETGRSERGRDDRVDRVDRRDRDREREKDNNRGRDRRDRDRDVRRRSRSRSRDRQGDRHRGGGGDRGRYNDRRRR